MTVFLFTYLFGLNHYRTFKYQSVLAPAQQNAQYAVFTRSIIFNKTRKKSSEMAFQFKTENYTLIEFNGDEPTLQHLPQLSQLQVVEYYCFHYAADVKDWNDHFILTEITI